MKRGSKSKSRIETGLLATLVAAVLFVCLLTGGDPEIFLIDDNRTQWYPVMERAYEDLWETGRIYCYDLYQMRGMPVAQQGYYGIMNPFMLLSFGVADLLPGGASAITFYIGIMVVLGDLFVYLALRRLGCGERLSFLMTMTYSTMGCFWAFFYWYYVFNNYFLIPLLVYAFLRCKDGRAVYCVFGIILAMDLWMGNVQYTCYHYILFGILCATMVLLKKRRYLGILFTNAAVGIGLSLPMFVLLLQASGDFQNRRSFFSYPVYYFSLLIHSVIPQGILQRSGRGISFLDSTVMGRDDNLVLYMGSVGILLSILLIRGVGRWLGCVRRCRCFGELRGEIKAEYERAAELSHERKVIVGCVAALLFFLSLMSGGIAACILYIMPVIGNFRYLFKAVFVAAPLAVMVLAGAVGEKAGEHGARSRFRYAAVLLTVVFTCVGIINAYDTIRAAGKLFDMRIDRTFDGEKEEALSGIEAADIDGKNYRTVTFFRFQGINDEWYDLSANLTRNFATAIGVFSLSGYEIAAESRRLEPFDAIYSNEDVLVNFANADIMKNFWINLTTEPEKVQRQLTDNSVRYLLLDKTELADNRMAQARIDAHLAKDYREDVIAALKKLPEIRVADVREFNEHYDLVEIDGVNSLCMDEKGNKVPLTDINMQTVAFLAQTAGDYTLSFAYDKHLAATIAEPGGSAAVLPLTVKQTENDNILISTEGRCGEVTLTYRDPVCTMGFVWEAMVSFVFLGLVVWLCRKSKI